MYASLPTQRLVQRDSFSHICTMKVGMAVGFSVSQTYIKTSLHNVQLLQLTICYFILSRKIFDGNNFTEI